uniref:Uncharacterized protein n=1 Tax=Romanomermis culicivorax TaxID=13658 RepID=A0A915KUR5_ROMCU
MKLKFISKNAIHGSITTSSSCSSKLKTSCNCCLYHRSFSEGGRPLPPLCLFLFVQMMSGEAATSSHENKFAQLNQEKILLRFELEIHRSPARLKIDPHLWSALANPTLQLSAFADQQQAPWD